jgi:hypothetical protein
LLACWLPPSATTAGSLDQATPPLLLLLATTTAVTCSVRPSYPPSCSYTQRALPLTKLLTLSLAPVRPTKLPAHHLFYPPDLSPLLLARAQPAELPCPLPRKRPILTLLP